ncbi:hypothetical protein D3C71_1705550 [compost metagenome]
MSAAAHFADQPVDLRQLPVRPVVDHRLRRNEHAVSAEPFGVRNHRVVQTVSRFLGDGMTAAREADFVKIVAVHIIE